MASIHWNLGTGTKRDKTIRGIHPQHVLDFAKEAPLDFVRELPKSLHTFKSQDYHVIPKLDNLMRHIDFIPITGHCYDDKNMALSAFCSRDGNIIATQFHPEAAPDALKHTLTASDEKSKKLQDNIRALHGDEALAEMINNADHLHSSHNLLRGFLIRAKDAKAHPAAA
jgi:hypothetical protein